MSRIAIPVFFLIKHAQHWIQIMSGALRESIYGLGLLNFTQKRTGSALHIITVY